LNRLKFFDYVVAAFAPHQDPTHRSYVADAKLAVAARLL
jgi:hypothetical protein